MNTVVEFCLLLFINNNHNNSQLELQPTLQLENRLRSKKRKKKDLYSYTVKYIPYLTIYEYNCLVKQHSFKCYNYTHFSLNVHARLLWSPEVVMHVVEKQIAEAVKKYIKQQKEQLNTAPKKQP